MKFFSVNSSNFLTLFRLIASPIIVPFLIFSCVTQQCENSGAAAVYLIISLTDFLDGFLARKYRQETVFGKLCDPLADKLLLVSTVVPFVALQQLPPFIVILILVREFFVMGVREIALYYQQKIEVSYTAKIKTALQMVVFTAMVYHPTHLFIINFISILLIIMLCCSLISAAQYTYFLIKRIPERMF